MPEPLAMAVLFVVGALAASMNALAGGGSLIAFPAQIALGASALHANATCSAALWLGGLGSALGYYSQLHKTRRYLGLLALPSALGSLVGAWLLTITSEQLFARVVPALVLLATLLLALRPWLRPAGARSVPVWLAVLGQFLICVYGGYFGAAMGILMLALMGLFIEGDLHQLNALKMWLAMIVNVVATAAFVWQGLVQLKPMLAIAAGALLGGYLAARLAQRIDPDRLRIFVVILGFALSLWFAYRAWL